VYKYKNGRIVRCKNNKLVRRAEPETLEEFISCVNSLLIEEQVCSNSEANETPQVSKENIEALEQRVKALKHATKVLVQAHMLARTQSDRDNRLPEQYYRQEFYELNQLMLHNMKITDREGLDALLQPYRCLQSKTNFNVPGTRQKHINDIRRQSRSARHMHYAEETNMKVNLKKPPPSSQPTTERRAVLVKNPPPFSRPMGRRDLATPPHKVPLRKYQPRNHQQIRAHKKRQQNWMRRKKPTTKINHSQSSFEPRNTRINRPRPLQGPQPEPTYLNHHQHYPL
jgi:hypothetical protein